MLKAVFFDAAGTLFDAREPVGHTYARLARRYGVDASDAAVSASFRRAFGRAPGLAFGPGHRPAELRRLEREWWRKRVADTFEPLGTLPDFDAYFEALFSYFADPAHWQADDEATAVLQRLKDRGLKLGVISNFDYRLYHILDGLGLTPYFDSITISSEAGYAKPSAKVFEVALQTAGVAPDEAMHVGDSEHLDLAAAEAAGLLAVLVDHTQAPGQAVVAGRRARIFALACMPELEREFQLA
ncbi:MAG TPA: HAD-IA family hydrolase [Candidatus Binataceae bacterium]